ncbi:MAG: SCP2 sterol-binding domain-containing protein [Candidatus Bathyarchaeaceae archaeon]
MGRVVDGYKQFVDLAKKSAEVKGLITGWDKVVQFIVDGDDNFYIETKGGEITFNMGVHSSPHVKLKGPEEVFYKMLTGELDQTRAYFAKQYTIEGSMSDAMKFGRIGTAVAKERK